jgi:hypothetical protein
MLEEYEAIEYAIALLPAVRQCVAEAVAERRAACYGRRRLSTDQALDLADNRIAEIVQEAGKRAETRCKAKLARGERVDSDAEFAREMQLHGLPPAGAKLYKRRREYPTESQCDQQARADNARAECDAIRASGGRPDTDAIYRKHCG